MLTFFLFLLVGTGAVYSFDPVGSYEREACRAAGAAQSLVQPFLDNQVSVNLLQKMNQCVPCTAHAYVESNGSDPLPISYRGLSYFSTLAHPQCFLVTMMTDSR